MSVTSGECTFFDDDDLEEITIAVMGPTGTGKTSFINLLSGSNLPVGGEMESCTSTVQTTEPFEFDGHRITLIDTPGFDDSTIRDTDVLAMIAAHLSFVYKHGKALAGVIYMHRIIDNRMGGISSRNFKMFRNLCGDSSLRNVVIVTNMWGQVDLHLGEAREKELASKDIFFKPVLDKGARVVRHDDTFESAQAILRSLLGKRPLVLQIQRELEEGLSISQTLAGKDLGRDLAEKIAKHREEMRGVMEEMEEASRLRDEETRKELASDRARLQAEITRIQLDARSLVTGYTEAMTKLENRLKENEAVTVVSAPHAPGMQHCGPRTPGDERQKGQSVTADNAVLEANFGASLPVFGFWGRLAVMLAPFSWKSTSAVC